LVEKLMLYIDNYNKTMAKPFEWTYGQDKIDTN